MLVKLGVSWCVSNPSGTLQLRSLITTGPKSYLAICSEPGIKWVTEKLADSGFRDIAGTFVRDVARRLKTERRLAPQRTPDPDAETAWRYTQGT